MRLEILKRVKHAILHSTSLGNGARRLGTRRDFWGTLFGGGGGQRSTERPQGSSAWRSRLVGIALSRLACG
jgi:hypothetical protein